MILDLPSDDTAEINVIGTGGGYGESIVVHLGGGHWMVVDSCRPPNGPCLPLAYLKEIGVSPEKVRLLLATHWHDDHIRGFSHLVEAFPQAEVALAWPHTRDALYKLVKLDDRAKVKAGIGWASSTRELRLILRMLESRCGSPGDVDFLQPQQDMTLLKEDEGHIEVIALSPSARTIRNYMRDIIRVIERQEKSTDLRIVFKKPNLLSIAAYLKMHYHRAILGADLEAKTNGGWSQIIDKCKGLKGQPRATLFKVPHHGSENAYDARVWESLLDEGVIANIAPWNLNGMLPTEEMLKKYGHLTKELYLTCDHQVMLTYREQKIKQAFRQLNIKLDPVKYVHGHIRSRINITSPESKWKVEYRGTAKKYSAPATV